MTSSTADVRKFLTDYFSDEELTTLCFDYFPEVYDSFASGMSKGQKVRLLLEYVQRREQQPDLLKILQQQRPAQYAKYLASLIEPLATGQPRPASAPNAAVPPVTSPQPTPSASTEVRALRVFLCHATNDKPAVRDLYRRLRADGFTPWLDEEDLLPGQHWQAEIPKAVRESDVVLVCLSQHSINKTGYVQKEIKFALDVAEEQPDDAIFLIPLRLEACEVPERLSQVQWVNFYDEGGYARLLRALRRRAADLNASATAAITSPPPEARGPSVSNVSGGVNIDGQQVSVGHDVVGRDKIIQATTYIEHATIIQPSPPPPVPTSAPNTMTWGGLQFVRVSAGKFIMGSNNNYDDEKPQHTVEIPYDYWIGKYPVTNEQFAKFVAAARYKFDQGNWQQKTNHPVVKVTWRDAMAYCQWLNDTLRGELKDLTLRLPTEAEWEKAARGGLSPVANGGNTEGAREWPWGNEFDQNKCNSSEGGKGNTTPVGAYSPQGDSPYGAADMVGNVWEWCHSLYKPYPYQTNDGREGEADSGTRVLRGGAFFDFRLYARCAYRYYFHPHYRNDFIGWRVVVSPGSRF